MYMNAVSNLVSFFLFLPQKNTFSHVMPAYYCFLLTQTHKTKKYFLFGCIISQKKKERRRKSSTLLFSPPHSGQSRENVCAALSIHIYCKHFFFERIRKNFFFFLANIVLKRKERKKRTRKKIVSFFLFSVWFTHVKSYSVAKKSVTEKNIYTHFSA